MSTYPPAPWNMYGHAYAGVWIVPRDHLPRPHAPGVKPLVIAGYGVLAAAFFRYAEPSPLRYDELVTAVVVREGLRVTSSVPQIWVDSAASRAGGRELWGIPKEPGAFDVIADRSYAAIAGEQRFATTEVGRVRTWPWRVPFGFVLSQCLDGRTRRTRIRGSARLGIARARWTFAADGPLSYLAGRRPLLCIALHRFRLAVDAGPLRPGRARMFADSAIR